PGPDPTIMVDFDLGATCFCGAISMILSGFQAQVSSGWYPGWVKDFIADAINSRLEGLTSNFGTSTSTGGPICPTITVLPPPPETLIQFGLPALAQDLDIQGTLYPTLAAPGQSLRLISTARNLGNLTSNPFTTD